MDKIDPQNELSFSEFEFKKKTLAPIKPYLEDTHQNFLHDFNSFYVFICARGNFYFFVGYTKFVVGMTNETKHHHHVYAILCLSALLIAFYMEIVCGNESIEAVLFIRVPMTSHDRLVISLL